MGRLEWAHELPSDTSEDGAIPDGQKQQNPKVMINKVEEKQQKRFPGMDNYIKGKKAGRLSSML